MRVEVVPHLPTTHARSARVDMVNERSRAAVSRIAARAAVEVELEAFS
jgi:hypothetical protein